MVGPVDCVVDEVVTVTTSGSAVPTAAIFGVTLPTTNRIEAALRFTPTGCFVWNHTGAEPTTTVTPVRILEITAPSGVDAGSRLTIDSPCIREQRAGVDGGSAATRVIGLSLIGAGAPSIDVPTADDRIAIFSTAVGSTDMAGVYRRDDTRKTIRSVAELQALFAAGVGRGLVDRDLVVTTAGAIGDFDAVELFVPDTGAVLSLDVIFGNGARVIWDHSGDEPGGGVNIMSIDFGNGAQGAGSVVRIENLRAFEHRSGVLGGSASTSIQGVVTLNRALTGEGKNTVIFVEPEIRIRSTGASSIVLGNNPSGPMIYRVDGGILDGPLGFDGKYICSPTDCTLAGATLVGTHIIGTNGGTNPRCFKSDNEANLTFIGGRWTTCYANMEGNSSVRVQGVVLNRMPASVAGNDGVFVLSESVNLSGTVVVQGAGPSSADAEALVLLNAGFLGSYDLEATATDCLSRFWFNPAGDSASGWLRLNSSPSILYGSGRVTISGPSGPAGAECGPRDLITNATDAIAERDNGIPLFLAAGSKRIVFNSDDGISRMPAAFAGDCENRADGYTVTITDDTAVGACTDAGADGVLDGGGSSVSKCKCDPTGDSGDGAWSGF